MMGGNEKMAKQTAYEKIYSKAKELLEDNPAGLRYSELVRRLHESLPEISINTIYGLVSQLKQDILTGKVKEIIWPERGVYVLAKYAPSGEPPRPSSEAPLIKVKEGDFYKPFADYLMNDLQECTKAIPLGGNKFSDKWGTPDVLGVYRFSELDPIKPPMEIVSAEIKADVNQLITAFGQACAYKLFSHKVYLVVPKGAEQDISRIESLCLRFGIGLIVFDAQNPHEPDFMIRARASKSEPDYFYVNEYLKRLDPESKRTLLS
jgi:hypothetical protein